MAKKKKQAPLGSGGRFRAGVAKLMAKGYNADYAKGVMAAAGRRKYGAKKMASMAAAGRKRKGK